MATHDSNIKAVVRFSNIKKFSAEKFAHFLNVHGQSVFKVEQTRVLYCGEGRVYAILELANRNSGLSFADVCKHALSHSSKQSILGKIAVFFLTKSDFF